MTLSNSLARFGHKIHELTLYPATSVDFEDHLNKTLIAIIGQFTPTGLCSKGTSISNPGSQLRPEEPLVSPSISSLMALALIEIR